MRYPAAEKLEIIRLVEQSHLPVRRVLEQIGIPRSTFYRWCDLYQTGGPEALDDRSPRPDRVWNRIPDDVRARIVTLALDEPELSPRELAVRFTDAERYFVSEASVYRLLKAHDLITSPASTALRQAPLPHAPFRGIEVAPCTSRIALKTCPSPMGGPSCRSGGLPGSGGSGARRASGWAAFMIAAICSSVKASGDGIRGRSLRPETEGAPDGGPARRRAGTTALHTRKRFARSPGGGVINRWELLFDRS